MIDLINLAERCEAATGPDRELDAEVYQALGLSTPYSDTSTLGGTVGAWVPMFTWSLDAAMTLVPEGWEVALYWGAEGFKPEAQLETEVMRRSLLSEFSPLKGTAEKITLALCAAALRARAA